MTRRRLRGSGFAQRNPDVRLYASLDELLAAPGVGVVDVATPHHRASRVPVLATVAAARKPAFIQKPLAMTYVDALEIADAFSAAGVPATVNQNMEFAATPYPETPWGGYAGLNFRPNRCLGWDEEIRNSQGATGKEACHAMPARWAGLCGQSRWQRT